MKMNVKKRTTDRPIITIGYRKTTFKNFGQKLEDFPNLQKWFETVGQRPAVLKGKAIGLELRPKPGIYTDEQRKVLFGQTASVVR